MITPPLAPHVDDPRLQRFLAEVVDYLHRISYLSPASPINLEIGGAGAHPWIDLTTLPAGVTAPLLTVPGGIETPGGAVVTPLPAPVNVAVRPVSMGGPSSYTYAVTYNTPSGETSLSFPVTVLGAPILNDSNGNLISWPVPPGVTTTNIYRLSSSGSGDQATIGKIATVPGSSYVDSGTRATTLPPATNTTCAAVANQYITTGGLTLPNIATAGQPTVTPAGVTGAITYTYGISVVTPTGETTMGTTGTTATGNATLTTTNSVGLTWAIPVGIPAALVPTLTYGIYRTASGGTPSTTGMIGVAGPFPAGTTPNLIDTGLPVIPGRPTAAPATNLANLLSAAGGLTGFNVVPLPTPSAPTVTTGGTSGATSYTYKIVAHDPSGTTPASSGTTIATGNATLTGTNYNAITWPPLPGNPTSYDVYRTASGGTPSSTGLIGTVYAGNPLTLSDTGLIGDASSPPASNTTGRVLVGGSPTGSVTSVATGTGLTGGPITSTGTIALADTAVTPATYGDSTHVGAFTVDQQGRLTAASSVAISSGMTIGNPVTSGTAGYVLYVDGSGNLANTNNLQLTSTGGGAAFVGVSNGSTTTGHLGLDAGTNAYGVAGLYGTLAGYLGSHNNHTSVDSAGFFTDGTRLVDLCDGTSAVNLTGPLRLSGSTSGFVGFIVPAAAGSTTYTLPAADGSAGDSLQTDASGNLSWGPSSSTTGTNGQVLMTTPYSLTNAYAQVTGANFSAPATGTYLIQAQVIVNNSGGFPTVDANFKLRNTTASANLGTPGHVYDSSPMQQSTITSPLIAIASLTSGDNVEVQAVSVSGTGTIDSVALIYVRLA